MDNNEKIKEIKITYEDGTEKVVERGVVFSTYEKGDDLCVRYEGVAGTEMDVVAVVAIMAKSAEDMGITKEFYSRAEEIK